MSSGADKGKGVAQPESPRVRHYERGDSSRGPGSAGVEQAQLSGQVPDISVDDYAEEDVLQIPIADMETFFDEEIAREQNHPRRSSSRASGFDVQVQDQQGNVTNRRLDVTATNQLDRGLRVVVSWNERTDQPIGAGGHLFNRFLSDLGGHWVRFPIYLRDWRKVTRRSKEDAWAEVVKEKFAVRDDRKRYGLMKMGDGWKTRRNRLFHDKNRGGTRPIQEVIEDVPDGVAPNDWASFVQYRRSQEAQIMSQRNTRSRGQQRIHHTAGSKTFAVTYSELERQAQDEGRRTNYGELYVVVHRHRDGTATSHEAEQAIERIEHTQAELRETQPESQGSALDPTAALRAGVGPVEHPGRCRGLGIGARPSMVYGRSSASEAGTSRAGTPGTRRASSTPVQDVSDDVIARVQAQVEARVTANMHEQMSQWREATNEMLRMAWQSTMPPGATPPQVPPFPTVAAPQPVVPPEQPADPEDDDDAVHSGAAHDLGGP